MGLTEKPKQDLITYRLAKADEVYQEAFFFHLYSI